MSGITKDSRVFQVNRLGTSPKGIAENDRRITYHTATLVGAQIFVLGQVKHNASNCHGCIFDLRKCTWTWLKVDEFAGHETILVDDSLFVVGNHAASRGAAAEVLQFDLIDFSWTRRRLRSPLPERQRGCASAFVEATRQLLTFGGYTPHGSSNAVYLINLDTLEWIQPEQRGKPPSKRNGAASCWRTNPRKTTLFIYGGRDIREYYNDLFVLDYNTSRGTMQWSEVYVSEMCAQVAYASLSYFDGQLLLWGGFNANLTDLNQLRLYDISEGTWHDLQEESGYELHGGLLPNSIHRAVVCYKGVVFVGGYGRHQHWIDVLSATG